MAGVLEQQTKRWTYEEYYRLDDERRYEIIDGALRDAPAPNSSHQDWSRELTLIVATYVLFEAGLDVQGLLQQGFRACELAASRLDPRQA